jgi:hypothetical protein
MGSPFSGTQEPVTICSKIEDKLYSDISVPKMHKNDCSGGCRVPWERSPRERGTLTLLFLCNNSMHGKKVYAYLLIQILIFSPVLSTSRFPSILTRSCLCLKKTVSYWTSRGSRFGYHFQNLLKFKQNMILSGIFFSISKNASTLTQSSPHNTLSLVLLITSMSNILFLC